jgi:ferredoxin
MKLNPHSSNIDDKLNFEEIANEIAFEQLIEVYSILKNPKRDKMYTLTSNYSVELEEACISCDVSHESCPENCLNDVLEEFAALTGGGVKYVVSGNSVEMWSTIGETWCADPDPVGTVLYSA